jgi:cell division protein FtsB
MTFKFGLSFRQVWMPFLGLMVVSYFTYHVFQGERGVIALLRVQKKVALLEKERNALQEQRAQLERNVYLLHSGSLDTDLLEERAREVLNFADPSEIIVNDGMIGSRKGN